MGIYPLFRALLHAEYAGPCPTTELDAVRHLGYPEGVFTVTSGCFTIANSIEPRQVALGNALPCFATCSFMAEGFHLFETHSLVSRRPSEKGRLLVFTWFFGCIKLLEQISSCRQLRQTAAGPAGFNTPGFYLTSLGLARESCLRL